MKKRYEKPHVCIVMLHGPALMLGGSHHVNEYDRGADIYAGDSDE